MLNVDELRRNGMSDAGPSPADRMADEILYQRVQAWLKDRFRDAELLEPGAHVDSAVRDAIGKVMQAYRREAAIALVRNASVCAAFWCSFRLLIGLLNYCIACRKK
jgi:hypothetical protein